MKKWIIYGICIASLLFGSYSVAAEDVSSQLAGGYTIEGIPSDHQLDKNVSYFYLKETPGESDQVKVKLTNDSSKEKILKVKVTNANTNINGIIDYTGQIKDHLSLKYPLTSMAKASQSEVKVPAKSSVETTIEIKMPDQTLPGVTVGGITVSDKQQESKSEKELSIGNIYTYTLGLVLTNESKVEPKKNVSVELDNVEAVLFDGKKIVQADILNPNPYLFGTAKVSGEILEKNSNKVVKEASKDEVSIAPYSVFPFQLDWKKDELKPGNYIFKGVVETKDNKWEFEKEFEITAEKAKEINNESVFKVQIPEWLTYTTLITSIVTIVGTVWLVVRKRRKKHE